MKTRPTPPKQCLSTSSGLSDITNVVASEPNRHEFTLKDWDVTSAAGQATRDLDPAHLDEALAEWNHFRMWMTLDFALDVKKVDTDRYEVAIHLRGIPSFYADSITLESFKQSVERFIEYCKRVTHKKILKGRFSPPS
jgi:hypothetical protein